MRKKIFRIMPTRVKVELVRNLLRQQLLVHLLCGRRKSIFVLLPAVEVDRLAPDLRLVLAGQLEWIVLVPMRNIDWITEYRTQELGHRSGIAQIGVKFAWWFRDQCRTLRAN